jgi:hypothetical protein
VDSETMYVCVERVLAETVKQLGFSAKRRPNIAVETSMDTAMAGYAKHHAEPAAVFRVLPSPELTKFCNKRGSWRVEGNFIPPSCLLQVR